MGLTNIILHNIQILFFIYHLKETADDNASLIQQFAKSVHTASHEIDAD